MGNETWHLDKRIPLALILTLCLQTVGITWWAAMLTARVDQLEYAVRQSSAHRERITRVESELKMMGDVMSKIEVKVDRLLERRGPTVVQ